MHDKKSLLKFVREGEWLNGETNEEIDAIQDERRGSQKQREDGSLSVASPTTDR